MKKVITLCLFVFALLLGSQTVVAQNSNLERTLEVNTKASEKAEAIRLYVKINSEQHNQIYDALQIYEAGRADAKATKEDSEKNETRLDETMKSILTAEQYERYVLYKKEN